MDFLVAFSILTSLWSVASGISKGIWASMSRAASSTSDIVGFESLDWNSDQIGSQYSFSGSIRSSEFKFFLIFASWVLLHVLAFVPPLSFLASLENHAHTALLAVNVYFVLHLLFSSATLNLLGDIEEIPSIRKLNDFLRQEKNRKKTAFFSIYFQLLFTIIALWISAAWMTSVAPFVGSPSVATLPRFIWPNLTTAMRGWIVNSNATMEKWMICNGASSSTATDLFNATTPTMMMNDSLSPPLDDYATSWYSRDICVTSIAPGVYFTSAVSSIVLFVYHVALVFFWPRIWGSWKKEWLEKTEAEMKVNEKWQQKVREGKRTVKKRMGRRTQRR